MKLSNSNILIFEEEAKSIELQLFTEDNYPIQHLNSYVTIGPLLEGNRISNFEMERKYNLIGGLDYLKFYVPPMQMTMFMDTNLVLELPEGIAFAVVDDIMKCTREGENGEQIQL